MALKAYGLAPGARPIRVDVPVRTMIINSLLDTDLYKFTMMQVVLHHFPGGAGRVPLQVPQPRRRPRAVHRRDPRRGAPAVHAALQGRRAGLPARDALHQERLRRFPRPVPAQREVHPYHAVAEGQRRDRHRDRRAVAAHHPVRDPGAGDRQRGLLPQHAAASPTYEDRPRALRDEDRAARQAARAWPTARSPTTARAAASPRTGTRRCCVR